MKTSRLFVAAVLLGALAGCSTIYSVKERYPRNKIYSGTVHNVTGSWWFMHGGFLDIPFSLVADTVILPYTVPKTIDNYTDPDDAWKPSGPITLEGLRNVQIGDSSDSVQAKLGRPDPYSHYCRDLTVSFDALGYETVEGGRAVILFDDRGRLAALMTFENGAWRYVLGTNPCSPG